MSGASTEGAAGLYTAAVVLETLASRPGGAQLLALAERRGDISLVGGAVRDLLLGRIPRELDAVVGSEPEEPARELLGLLEGEGEQARLRVHGRFGTAAVEWGGGRIDLARRRAEDYPAPGALPEVRPGDTEADLRRRDFTVNAIALPLAGPGRGRLVCVEHALEDLAAGRLRVLHDRSFSDDPTRLLRLARYRVRLGFSVEEHTAELASAALAEGALATVSGARIGTELRLALEEADPLAALSGLADMGILQAIGLTPRPDLDLARRAIEVLPADGRARALLMALLLAPAEPGPAQAGLLDRLEFPGPERDRILAVLAAPSLASAMGKAGRPSQLRELLASRPVEAVAMAGALGPADAARRWLGELRHIRLSITGEDLLAAGLPPGPEIGRRLELTLARRLDGELKDGREAELRFATTEGI